MPISNKANQIPDAPAQSNAPKELVSVPSDAEGSIAAMIVAAIVLFLGGIALTIYFFFFFGTNVPGEQVFNIGLLNERECGVIIGVGACIAACLVGVFSLIIGVTIQLERLAVILTTGNNTNKK